LKVLRIVPLAVFIVGIAALAVTLACGSDEAPAPTATPTQEPPTETPTATATATSTPSPTPSPTPYNGAIARLKLHRFGIDAPIEEMAINGRGELDTPKRENTDVAWYYIFDKPGRVNPDNTGWLAFGGLSKLPTKGNAVFSAHVYYHDVPAPFQKLAQSQVGDDITVQMEDGRQYKYKVLRKDRYNRETIDMEKVIWPKDKPADNEWLTMITCGGALDSTGQEYVDRDVIIAERVD
jgi:hypothetical protein